MSAICTVWDYLYTIDNQPAVGKKIIAELSAENTVYTSGGFVIPKFVETTTNSSGYFELSLIQSAGVSGMLNTQYHVWMQDCYYSKLITIPSASGARLRDL